MRSESAIVWEGMSRNSLGSGDPISTARLPEGGHATSLGRWRSSAALNGFPHARAGRSHGVAAKIPLKHHKFAAFSHLDLTLGCYIRDEVESGLYTSRAKF